MSEMWEIINLDNDEVTKLNEYRGASSDAVNQLYAMSAKDKALLVPYIKIWKRVERGHRALLSSGFYTPPQFGKSLASGEQFGERPDASIERISVKSHAPRGWRLFRELDLNITVHRPEAVFGESNTQPATAMRDMLDFRNDMVIEYGWNGPESNVLVSGPNIKDKNSNTSTTNYETSKQIRFKVTSYNFQLTPAGEAKFQIHGIENGEVAIRDMTIFSSDEYDKPLNLNMADEIRKKVDQMGKELVGGKGDNAVKTTADGQKFVRLQHVFNVLFAKPLVRAALKNNFKHVSLQFGSFNSKCPRSAKNCLDKDYKNKSIGSYYVNLEFVTGGYLLGYRTNEGYPISIDAMMSVLIRHMQDQTLWVGDPITLSVKKQSSSAQVPEIMLRTLYDSKFDDGSGKMTIQVVDRKKYIPVIKSTGTSVTRAEKKAALDKFLSDNSIPMIDLYNQGSVVKSTNFGVTNEEQMKDIFIRRQIQRSRGDITTLSALRTSNVSEASQIAMLYRSAIKGDVTMLGNFFFDILGTVWVNFGIWAYNGLFYVIQHVDNIGADGFDTVLSLIAEGSDPLNMGPEDGLSIQEGIIDAQKKNSIATAEVKQAFARGGTLPNI